MDTTSADYLLDRPLPPTEKVYRERGIVAATFLGGPLAGGYMLAMNFKAFNEPTKARWAIAGSVAFTLTLCCVLIFAPSLSRVPSRLITLAYTGIMWMIAHQLQYERLTRISRPAA